jgi:hypothetical protein
LSKFGVERRTLPFSWTSPFLLRSTFNPAVARGYRLLVVDLGVPLGKRLGSPKQNADYAPNAKLQVLFDLETPNQFVADAARESRS